MLWRAFKALSAAIIIAALLAGIPVALGLLGHNPLPALSEFVHNPAGRDDGSLFLAVFTCVGWLAWLSFTVAVITEAPALFGRNTRTLPGLSGQQWLARTLLSTVAAAIITPSITSATAAAINHHDASAARPVAIVQTATYTDTIEDDGTVSGHADTAVSGTVHVVQRGEVLLDLAERYFQDRGAVKAIAEANYGVAQPDGRALERGHTRIYAGWTLQIPVYDGITPAAVPAAQAAIVHAVAEVPAEPQIVLASTVAEAPATTYAVAEAPATTYEVCRGDTLWDIAASQLGDPEDWQQIWKLNKGKTFDDGRTFTRPGLIQPGWVLILPTASEGHIVTPAPGKPTPPPDSYVKKHAHDGDEQPIAPSPQQPTVLPGDDGVVNTPATPTPTPSSQDQATASPAAPVQHGEGDGFSLPSGSWISLGLAAALAGAARLVWAHRRRRYTPKPVSARPRTNDPDLVRTPPVIRQVRARLATPATDEKKATAAVPESTGQVAQSAQPIVPPTATAAAPAVVTPQAGRGVLIAALAAGVHDIDARGHVVLTASLLTELIPGTTTGDIAAQPRLTVTTSTGTAADWCEQQLLLRARTLAEHDQPDAQALRDADPFADPMPPITLLTAAEDADARLVALAAQGAAVNLHWITVSASAHHSLVQQAALAPSEALDLLRTLTESHTGLPQPITSRPQEAAAEAPDEEKVDIPAASSGNDDGEPASETETHDDHAVTAAPAPSQAHDPGARADPAPELRLPVKVSVLGPLEIHDPAGQPKPRRKPAWELMAYLIAVGGRASNNAILEDLLPDVPRSLAPGQLHTMVTGLRNLLTAAAGGGKGEDFLTHPPGFYVLKPDLLQVDLWRVRAALKVAATATSPAAKADALRLALAEVGGRFADGSVFEWMEPFAVGITRQVLDARVALATTLTELGQPEQALAVLQEAIDEEPLAEDLYRQAMDLHALLGDADAIRRLRRIVTHLLEQHGMEPTDDLDRHADNLLANLRRRRSAQAQKAAAAYATSKERNPVR